MSSKTTITVEATIHSPIEIVWKCWTSPEHIIHWNFASEDWKCPTAENDLKPGGKFSWRMEAKDGSMGFDYSGTYEEVVLNKRIIKHLDDGRRVEILFGTSEDGTEVTETFEVEDMNSVDLQRQGWQAILNNFKKHTESQ